MATEMKSGETLSAETRAEQTYNAIFRQSHHTPGDRDFYVKSIAAALAAAEAQATQAERERCATICQDRASRAFAKSLGAHPWGDGGAINESDVQAEADACAADIEAEPADGTKGGK